MYIPFLKTFKQTGGTVATDSLSVKAVIFMILLAAQVNKGEKWTKDYVLTRRLSESGAQRIYNVSVTYRCYENGIAS